MNILIIINCTISDEFNLVCYTSMYDYISTIFNLLNNNEGNLIEMYVSIITIYLSKIIKLIILLVKMIAVLSTIDT